MSYLTDTSTPASKVIHLDSAHADIFHLQDADVEPRNEGEDRDGGERQEVGDDVAHDSENGGARDDAFAEERSRRGRHRRDFAAAPTREELGCGVKRCCEIDQRFADAAACLADAKR